MNVKKAWVIAVSWMSGILFREKFLEMRSKSNRAPLYYVPVARDGSTFHKGLRSARGYYTVGDKKAEKKFESYEEALAYLRSVPVARWRRPNKNGIAGIVSAIDWVRA